MADITFNTTAGQTIGRELLIACRTFSAIPTPR